MPLFSVVILHGDAFAAESMRHRVLLKYPHAKILIVDKVAVAISYMLHERADIFIACLETVDDDTLDLLLLCHHRGCSPRKTLAITNRPAARVLRSLRALTVAGVLDVSNESTERMENVISILDAGGVYWSPGVWERAKHDNIRLVFHQLAPSEQLGIATFGDGCGDGVAAERLNMTSSTVRSLRRDLHAKLGVSDRHEMIRIAAKLGYTRFTADGIVAYGLAIIVLEYLTRSKRPVALPQDLLARCQIAPNDIVSQKLLNGRTPQSYTLKAG